MLWPELKFRIRALFRRAAMDRELADELRYHIESQVERHVRAGMPRREAERRARMEFGGVEQIAEDTRGERGTARLDALRQDVRYAWRGVKARPGFAAAVVLTLGLGIGANAAMFSVVDRLLLRAPAYLEAAERVHRVYMNYVWNGGDRSDRNFAYPAYQVLRNSTSTLDGLAGFFYHPAQPIGRGDEIRELPVAIVTASLFDFFDATPALGRFFTTQEDAAPASAPVAVLGYAYWQSAHGGRSSVLGQQIHIGDVTYTIVGVAPRNFAATSAGAAPVAFLPLTAHAYARTPDYAQNYGWTWLEILVRRRPDVTQETATADVAAALVRAWEAERASGPSIPSAAEAQVTGLLSPVHLTRGPDAGPQAKVAGWVLGVAVIVLLIAAANVVNLLLARAVHRRREIALRLALGVSRPRLVQQLLVETLLLALLGGAMGLLFARWSGGVVGALFLGGDGAIAPDARTLLFTAVLTLAAALLTGFAPALQAMRADVAATLKAGMREGAYRRSPLRTSLLLFQAGLCVVLLVGAGLFVRSLLNVQSLRLGYDAGSLVVVDANLRGLQLTADMQNELAERMRLTAMSVPGVQSATLLASTPFSGSEGRGAPTVPGRDSLQLLGRYTLQTGSPEYFETMGTRILRGRGFEPTDVHGAPPIVVIGRSMADAIWPGEDALGKQLRFGDESRPMLTVVGVAEDVVNRSLGTRSDFWYYLPFDQYRVIFDTRARPNLFVRVSGEPAEFVEVLRERLQREMPGDAYVRAAVFADLLEPQTRSWRVGATMFVIFAALALVLAGIGLYSVVAYAVAQRTREMGVRVALGATAANVVRMIVGQGVAFALVGIVAGSAVALYAASRMEPLLFDSSPRDPVVYGGVAVVLILVAVAATLRPALRASRVDPTVALRAD